MSKKKQKKIKVIWKTADIPEKEREERVSRAFAILFDVVWPEWVKEMKAKQSNQKPPN